MLWAGHAKRAREATSSFSLSLRGVISFSLASRQAEIAREVVGNPKELDRDLTRSVSPCMASQPCLPRETRMSALRARKDHACVPGRSGGWWDGGQTHLDALMAHEVHAGAPMFSAAPILPQERGRIHLERMEQHADLAWLGGRAAIPLTLVAQGAGTTTTHAGPIDHAQASISLSTRLLGDQRLPCWTWKRPIGLERKVLSREPTGFPRRVAVVGGPYPAAGADEAGRVAACSLGAMAAANSVMRRGIGSN
jgi:hypothetical protein